MRERRHLHTHPTGFILDVVEFMSRTTNSRIGHFMNDRFKNLSFHEAKTHHEQHGPLPMRHDTLHNHDLCRTEKALISNAPHFRTTTLHSAPKPKPPLQVGGAGRQASSMLFFYAVVFLAF